MTYVHENRPRGEVIVHAERDPAIRGVALHFMMHHEDGTVSIAKPVALEWARVSDSESWGAPPTLRLRDPDVRAIIEGLDAAGMRHEVDAKRAGELEATKSHLSDMRALLGMDGGKRKLVVDA